MCCKGNIVNKRPSLWTPSKTVHCISLLQLYFDTDLNLLYLRHGHTRSDILSQMQHIVFTELLHLNGNEYFLVVVIYLLSIRL